MNSFGLIKFIGICYRKFGSQYSRPLFLILAGFALQSITVSLKAENVTFKTTMQAFVKPGQTGTTSYDRYTNGVFHGHGTGMWPTYCQEISNTFNALPYDSGTLVTIIHLYREPNQPWSQFCEGLYATNLSSCRDLFVNGIKATRTATGQSVPIVAQGMTANWFVEFRPRTSIEFTFKMENGLTGSLPADGHSIATPTINTQGITWSIVTNASYPSRLGCTIIDSAKGTIRAGTQEGTILVRATFNGCTSEAPLELTCGGKQDSDCGNCDKNAFSTASGSNGSIDFKLGLGWASIGNTAGHLSIKADSPSTNLYIPRALLYNFRRSATDVDVVTNDWGLRQIKVPEGLVNIVTNGATNGYEIFFYTAAYRGEKTDGLWQLIDTNEWVTRYSVTNENNDINLFRVYQNGATTPLYSYNYLTSGSSNGWEFVSGSGSALRKETLFVLQANNQIYETRTVSNDTALVHYEYERYTNFVVSANVTNKLLLERVEGTGANSIRLTNTYRARGLLESQRRSDGYWEHYVYDSSDRPSKLLQAFGNQSYTTTENLCRLFEYTYSTNVFTDSVDPFKMETNTPRRTIESVLGNPVRTNYAKFFPGGKWDIECAISGSAESPDNLITKTRLRTNGIGVHFNSVQSVEEPDGTVTVYLPDMTIGTNGVPLDLRTNIVLRGHPNDASNTKLASANHGPKPNDPVVHPGSSGQTPIRMSAEGLAAVR